MRAGDYDINLPERTGDESVDQLAAALLDLSQSLDQRFQQLRTLQDVAEQVNRALLLDQVCEHVYGVFRDTIPYDRIGLALLEDGGRVLRARWARSESDTVRLPVGYAAALEGSSLQRVLETGEPRILNDLEAYLAEHPDSDSTRLVVQEGVRSSLTCPLTGPSGPVGMLFFSSFERSTYDDAHVEVYLLVASQLSVIVEKSRLYQELLELDRMKDRVLGMAAHDLRNPLALVLANLELLQLGLGGELSPGGQRVVARAVTAAERMVVLIEDLLDVSAIESGELVLRTEELELCSWLSETVEDQRMLARSKDIQLELEHPEAPVRVQADPQRLDQVLTNLVSNAVKYSLAGTKTRVVLRVEGGEAIIEVIDQGQGIPHSELGRLFKPFGRTSVRPTGGESSTGLGLAIGRRLVEAHGGRMEVESEAGRGSLFRARLPLRSGGA
jgi:signal transduction histidine kinase